MLRNLQGFVTNASIMNKASVGMKRGNFVNVDRKAKTLALASTLAEGVYIVDRDIKVTPEVAMGFEVSDYDVAQDIIEQGEFASVIALHQGQIWATSEYGTLTEVEAEAGKYLTITNGKLEKSASNAKTVLVSHGWYMDGTHKLLAFEIVK